jgi:hypothetical protein
MIGGAHVKGAKFVVTQADLKEISLVPDPGNKYVSILDTKVIPVMYTLSPDAAAHFKSQGSSYAQQRRQRELAELDAAWYAKQSQKTKLWHDYR